MDYRWSEILGILKWIRCRPGQVGGGRWSAVGLASAALRDKSHSRKTHRGGQAKTMLTGPSDERWGEIILVLYPRRSSSSGCWRGLNIKRALNCGWPPCPSLRHRVWKIYRPIVGMPHLLP